MKSTICSVLALVVLVALVPTVHAAESCTAATLKGNYGFTFNGFFQNPKKNDPISGIGSVTFDGAGNASATVIASFNGSLSTFPWTGTYTLNSDCTGSLTSTPGSGLANFSIVVVRGGTEVFGVDVDPGGTWTINLKK